MRFSSLITGRILILAAFVLVSSVHAQVADPKSKTPETTSTQTSDELLVRLSAAESHQRSGDLASATVENRAALSIALQRYGLIAIEEAKYAEAVDLLTDSLKYGDGATNRTNLAIAYLRQNELEKALDEAKKAVSIDSEHFGARYILGNIYYAKEDYEAALPELEMIYSKAPDIETARALGFTYLSLKKPELARKQFDKLQALVGKPSVRLHMLFAKFYERTNYPAEAERELKRALAIDPNAPQINLYLGYLLMQHGGSGRLPEAGEAFARELEINPDEFYSLFFGGVVASSLNDHKKAIPLLEKAVRINPESGEAHLFLAQSQIELEDLVNAEKNLRRAVELEAKGGKNTQARRTHFILGRLLVRTGRKEEGRKELAIAGQLQRAALDSSRDEISRILGQVAGDSDLESVDENKIDTAREVKLTPERAAQLEQIKTFLTDVIAQTYANLGVIATQSNQLSEAMDNFSAAYKWKPDFPNLSRNFGIVSFRAGKYKEAIDPLKRHLRTDPQDVLIRKMLGSSYYFTKSFAKSVETLKPMEGQLSDEAELAYFYGISLIRLQQNRDSEAVFDRLAKVSQENPEALFYAAQGFMISGNFDRAVEEFKQVLSVAPETRQANLFIGQSLVRLNRLAEAEGAFARELEINPSDALSRYHLALTLIERKIETDRAIRLLEEASSLRYKYADAHYQLGKIYLEMGDSKKAVDQLELAVSADASKDYIHYQLSIAYRKVSREADADRELKVYQKLKDEKRKTDQPMPMGNDNSPGA